MSNDSFGGAFKGDQLWPTIASFLIPAVQLIAIVVTQLSDTLQLKSFFINFEILPFANILSVLLIVSSIGIYWHWKKNYNFIYSGANPYPFPAKKIQQILFNFIIASIIICFLLIGSLISGKYLSESIGEWIAIISVVQVISYVALIYILGIIAYIGLNEYIEKQRDFKIEQYIPNLLSSMQLYGIASPKIHIKSKQLIPNQFKTLINIEIDQDEKYLITSYDGKEIIQELSATDYAAQVQSQNQAQPAG